MMQKHNRHMSFSLYISVLAVTDTICLLIGELMFLIPVNLLLAVVEDFYANDMIIGYTYAPYRRKHGKATDAYNWPLGIEVAWIQSEIYVNGIIFDKGRTQMMVTAKIIS